MLARLVLIQQLPAFGPSSALRYIFLPDPFRWPSRAVLQTPICRHHYGCDRAPSECDVSVRIRR